MKVVDGIEKITSTYPFPVVTIGNFDGVHLGHQEIFRRVIEQARAQKGTSMVFTFEPHPLRVIAPERAPKLLTTYQDKLQLIESCGIDVLVCAHFTREFAHLKAEDFVSEILADKLNLKELHIGANYHFGKGRKGTTDLLKKLGRKIGFTVRVLPELKVHDVTVSSSRIRTLVARGKVEEAALLLGRHYSVCGVVIEGAKRGKSLLEIPTANLSTVNELLPRDGVYAVTVELEGKVYGGALNIGFNPTFTDKNFSVETHILDFEGEIVGKHMRVEFVQRIREEKKFSNVSELAHQMKQDISVIKSLLKNIVH